MNFSYYKCAVLVLLLTGCAATHKPEIDYNPEYNFSKLHTFAVIENTVAENIEDKVLHKNLSSLDDDRFVKAVTNTLKQKGMMATDKANADMHVRFQLVTKDKVQLRTYNTSFYHCWYCRGFYGPLMNYHQVDFRDYVEGTIIIDFIDPGQGKSIWRSVMSKALTNKRLSVQQKQIRMQEQVNAMLVSFKKPTVVVH